MVIDPRTSRFWQETLRSGLLDEAALRGCWEAIPQEKREAEAIDRRLARQAVASGHLTLWQAQQVLAGRAHALKIGKYVVVDIIGKGGMGLVFLAQDTRLRRPVAIKVLSRERMSSPRALARFEREAKVGAQLQHDNLVRIYDEGEYRDLRFLVMEYIEGRNVAQILAEVGPLPTALAASIARQVAHGLEHARLKGLIHRDVNPQNILVTRDGIAKLADLGLAIDLGDPDDVVTRDGATVGTFDYISPEQARHPRSVDTRSDLYSLGCTIYHMIAGRVPFAEASLPEKLYAHQLHPAEPLSSRVTGIPTGLEAIVRRLMAKAPEDRFPTPQALADALAPFAEGAPAVADILATRPEAVEEPGKTPPPAAAPDEGSDPNGYRLGPESARGDLPPTRTSSSLKGQPRAVSATAMDGPRGKADQGVDPESVATRPTEPEPEDGPSPPARSNGLGLPIDLGPEPSLTETLSASRSRSRSSASRSSSGTGSTDKAPAVVEGPPPRPSARSHLRAIAATLGVLAIVAVLLLVRPDRAGDEASGTEPPRAPSTDGSGRPVSPSTNSTPDGAPTGFAVGRGDGGGIVSCENFQDALLLAPNNGGTVFVGESVEPIRMEPGKAAFLAPDAAIVIRPLPGTRPKLSIAIEGEEPWLRQSSGSGTLTLEELTVQVHYGGTGRRGATRPPLIESHGELTLRRCSFAVRSSRGRDTCAAQSSGRGSTIVGCLFVGFDRPLDVVAYAGMRHELSQCIFAWPRGADDRKPGWVVRLEAKPSGHAGPPRLTIENCTALRAAGLVETTSLLPDHPLQLTVVGSGLRADSLVAWAAPDEGASFPSGLRWTGKGNRYDVQGTAWVVSAADGLNAPDNAPTDLDSWVESLGDAGADDSAQALVELTDESSLESDTLDPSHFAARSGDDPIGADPSQVGPPGGPPAS